jgi:hypothetical protein
VLASGVTFMPPTHPSAELDGRPISLADVARYHCHDLVAGSYRCFATAAERDADLASVEASVTAEDFGALAVIYVLAYEHSNYGGASIALSQPTPNLASIGWNDAVSSFKSTNGGRPKWWEHSSYSGTSWRWVASAWVAYVGDAANDRFSSVQNVP